MSKSRLFVTATLSLCIVQALLVLASWMISAVFPAYGFNSLLSGPGIRWLLSCYVDSGCSDFMTWFLVYSFFAGTFVRSGLPKKIISFGRCNYDEKFAIVLFFLVLMIGVSVCLFFALHPHSPLLGVTGMLVPGPFLKAAAFVMGVSVFVGSVAFLILSGEVKSCDDAADALVHGFKVVAPLIVVLFLLKVTLEMGLFVFRN